MQEDAYDSYERLMNLIKRETRTNEPSFPDWYGGCYVDGDNLVVLTVNGDLDSELSDAIVAEIRQCEYSYNTLYSVVKEIRAKIESVEYEVAKNIAGYGVNDESNRVLVNLKDVSKDKIQEFKDNVSASPAIIFAESSGFEIIKEPSESTFSLGDISSVVYSLRCGSLIMKAGSIGGASLGYRVKSRDTGEKGLITAGHFISKDQLLLSANGDSIAKCVNSYYKKYLDAAFCSMNNKNYIVSNRIKGLEDKADSLSIKLAQPDTGIIVNGVGAMTKNFGKVLECSYDIVYEEDGRKVTYFPDVILIDFIPEFGDSGGIVYAYNKSLNERYTVGIIMGQYEYSQSPLQLPKLCCVCIKANVINLTFNVDRY